MANSKRKCSQCKTYKIAVDGIVVNGTFFCDIDCATNKAFGGIAKGRAIKHKSDKKALKDNDRKIRMPAAQKAFNAFIRARDDKLPCISCDKFILADMPYGKYDCGHYKTVGGFPELRFEELNASKQCKSCNGGAGNFSKKDTSVSREYRENLIKKIGLDKVEWLEGPHEPKKYTCAELKEIELKYKKKLKELTND
jgi:hypothetical protein